MAKDPIKKADNGTYYFRANLGYNPITGKQIQKYRSGFRTKKEAKEEYSKLVLASTEELTTKKDGVSFQQFIEETYLPWYKTQVKESTYLNRATTIKKHFSYFYKMETDEIEPIHVQNWHKGDPGYPHLRGFFTERQSCYCVFKPGRRSVRGSQRLSVNRIWDRYPFRRSLCAFNAWGFRHCGPGGCAFQFFSF